MKKQLALCLMAFSFATSLFSQKNILAEKPQAIAERLRQFQETRFPPVFAATLPESLDAVFDSMTALSPVKGFNAAMLLPDGTYWKRASGLAEELPATVPLTTEHLMAMGSISKTFVATTLLLLMEEGMFSLDDSIGQYIGPYPNVAGSITIRQLLSHRSGLNDYLNENLATSDAWSNDPTHIWTADEILNGYVLAPNFAAGTAWSYSNTNFLLGGVLIETLTGQPWYEVVRQKLFDPLGLSHTFVYPWESPGTQPISHVWADLIGTGDVQDVQGLGLPVEGLFSLANSAGCLLSTPEDLTKFLERLFSGHVLQPATLAEMQTDYLQNGSNAKYGLGAASFELPQQIENWGHNGDLTYKSFALYFPSENMSLAVQQNDDRSEEDPIPVLDLYDVYLALLNVYLNYTPPSATGETASAGNLVVYPNPVQNEIMVKCDLKNCQISPQFYQVLDINGRLLISGKMKAEEANISVVNLPSGLYLLKFGENAIPFIKE